MAAPERTVSGRRPSPVARTALFDRLSAGYTGGVTLVSAPAGSGKTVLLRSWIEAAGLGKRTAWVSVERDERDEQRFWLAVVEALRTAAGIEGPIDDLGPAPGFDGDTVVERIIDGAQSLDEPLLLVIDDLHYLLEPRALSPLELLLDRRPPQLRVILSTRHDPPLGLHRLRLAGELTELRATDLRFGLDETNALLSAAGITLSAAAVGSLHARTEGWVAGLRLAALSLAGRPDPERFVAEFSGSERTVADYLFAEVLQREPEPVRQLLLRTSILERVNGSVADRLLGTEGSERILLELEDAGAFVYSIDRERSWFRYHNLLADLLRLELRRTEPAAVPGLHRGAAEWYAEHGFPIDAIRHAQAAGDWRYAGDLIGQFGFSISLDGSFATMRALLEPFPKEAFANPELAAFLGYGEVIRPSLDTAASYIALAERHASEVPQERLPLFEAMLTTAKLTLARWRGDYSAAVRDVPPLLEPSQAETVGQIAAENDVRAVALMTLGIVEVWAGAGDDAERHLREAAELARRIGRPYVEQGCLAHLAVAVARHSISRGRELALQALDIQERYGWQSEPVVPIVFATIGAIDVLQGRFDEAEPWLDRAERSLRPNTEPAKEILVRYSRGLHRLGQGRPTEAIALFAEAQRLASFLVAPDPLAIAARALQAQTLAGLGDPAAARTVLETASAAEREFAEMRTALAAIHLAERNPRAAVDALAPLRAGELPAIADYWLPNGFIVYAVARDLLGDSKAAEEDVEHALDLAEPDGLVLPFLVAPARGLLERHPRHRTAHAALLSTILDVLAGSPVRARRGEAAELAEDLTESEIRVLRYLPSNLSAPEIAAEVFLSTSTVKTHMRHIYEKLGVHKRTEAVERARELGLLGPSTRTRR
jgi:LuxR family transcriptional regulator, maltose regulon positive regulatory protein